MFPSTPVDEIPESIPFITNNLNQYCNSQITLMLNKIANDYSLDISKLKSSCFEPVNLKLSTNIHYPAHNSSRCKARVWNGGRGGQCKRKQHEDGLCKIHYKKLLVCKNNNCENGIKGLGACKCGSNGNGLWLGTIDNPKPRLNKDGKRVIKWLDDKTKIKKKKKKFKIKSLESCEETKEPCEYTDIEAALLKLLNNIDLDDSSLTNCVIMKRLEIVLKKDLNTFKKQIYNTINTFWDELVAKEFSDDDDTDYSSHFDIESKLTTYYVGDTTYYVHTQTNEIYDNPKTLNVIGIMLSDKKFDLF